MATILQSSDFAVIEGKRITRGTGHLVDYSDGVRISQHQAHGQVRRLGFWCEGGIRSSSPLQKQ